MSDTADNLEHAWIDVNSFTKKEWDQIRDLGRHMRESGFFKGDPMKCIIGAFILLVEEGLGSETVDPVDNGLH